MPHRSIGGLSLRRAIESRDMLTEAHHLMRTGDPSADVTMDPDAGPGADGGISTKQAGRLAKFRKAPDARAGGLGASTGVDEKDNSSASLVMTRASSLEVACLGLGAMQAGRESAAEIQGSGDFLVSPITGAVAVTSDGTPHEGTVLCRLTASQLSPPCRAVLG